MKIALLAAALLAVAPAFATNKPPPAPAPSSHSSSASTSSSSSSAIAGSVSAADVDIGPVTVTATPTATATGGAGGAGGSASSTASATGGNGNSSVTVSAPRNAPSLAQGSLVPSGCGAGANGGGSNTHGAGFLGLAWTTDECYLFMLGEKFAAIGMPDTACDIWLQTKAAQRAFKGKTPPSCTISRPTPTPTELTVKMVGPPLAIEIPTVPIEEAPAPKEAAACTPPAPPKKRRSTAGKKPSPPMPPVVTCIR